MECTYLTMAEQGGNNKSRKSNTDSIYSQMESVLNSFVEKTKIFCWSRDDWRSKCKSSSISKRSAILLKVKELLELLKDVDNGKDAISQDDSVYQCEDMSLTLANADYISDNTNDLDSTNYSGKMDITCTELSFFKTPTTALRSILKSAQTQRSESGRRKVRFEDELEETLAEIIENKENLNWGPMIEESSRLATKKGARNKTPPINESRIRRPVSVGKTVATIKILSRNNKPRKSWASCRDGSTDLKALRDIKTLVEIENERRLNSQKNSNISNQKNHTDVDSTRSIKTPKALLCSTPSSTGLRLSLIPDDLDVAGLSWTPGRGIVLDSSISFE